MLTGKHFFPQLITQPFHHGLVIVFGMAFVMSIIGASFSVLRGGRYVHGEHDLPTATHLRDHLPDLAATAGAVPGEIATEDERR
jgi:aspartyl/asparaginyl beta-hydroxylase (cupin superfamily)